uniref:Secreted protein n=1 Tax=Peronospora matthiolae TaxID=2874970 RepID=A0AAV1UX85_9STRA
MLLSWILALRSLVPAKRAMALRSRYTTPRHAPLSRTVVAESRIYAETVVFGLKRSSNSFRVRQLDLYRTEAEVFGAPVCREREVAPVSVQDEDILPKQALMVIVSEAVAAATTFDRPV